MQLLKKVISLLLVVAMLSSFALVASAEDTAGESAESINLVLEAYREDGTKINAGETITTGETFNVRIITKEEFVVSTFIVMVQYDPDVLQGNKASGKYGDICSEFLNKAIEVYNTFKRTEDTVPEGTPVTQLTLGQPERNVTAPAETTWAEFSFTALKDTDATALTAHVPADDFTYLEGLDPIVKNAEFTFSNLSMQIVAAPATVESVAVTPDSVTLNPGKTQQLTAAITPSEAEATVTWESDNEEVATVSDTGLVTAIGVGNAVITATAGEKTATCAVKVEAADPITEFACALATEQSVLVNGTATLRISLATSDGSTPEVSWAVTGDDCLTISNETASATSASCTVTGTKTGIAYVTATSGTHSATYTVEVIARSASNVVIPRSTLDANLSYPIGRTIPLTATVTPDPEGEWNIRWQTSDPSVARIDGDTLTTVGAGTAQITARAGGKSANVTITVVDNSQVAQGNYKADMSGDATQKAVSGQQVSVPITIDANNSEPFNAIDLTVAYDPTKLEAVNQVEGLDGCTVEISNGKIHVMRYGTEQATPTVLKVFFKVTMTEGTTDVVLKEAYVDQSANAVGKEGTAEVKAAANAPAAAITRATTTLEVASVHTVTLPDTMQSNQGTTVADGEDYTFSVKNKDAYHDYDVTATVGGEAADVTENADGTYTIKGVTGDVTIQMTATAKTFNVAFFGQAQDATGETTATYGKDYTFTVTEQEGYTHDVSVTIGGKDYTVAGVGGAYTIPGADVTGDIFVTITRKDASGAVIYTVTVAGAGASEVTADATAKASTAFAFTLTPEENIYYTVEVTVNGTVRTPSVVTNEDGTRTYTIAARYVTGNIWIDVAKDEAYKVTFEYPTEIIDSDGISVTKPTSADKVLCITPKNAESLVKKGGTYTFTVETFAVYDLKCEVTEDGAPKAFQDTVGKRSVTRVPHTFTIENVQGDLHIKLSRIANMDYVEVQVKPFVELDDKTVFLVATCTKAGGPSGTFQLDTYDGHPMYRTKTYMSNFANPDSRQSVYLWLTIVPKGESYGVEQALEHLYYTLNSGDRPGANQSDGIKNNADVNLSGMVDINDAQLIFDIYNGEYQTFYRTNAQETATIPNYGIGASMDKFLEADVNRDMKITLEDAAAIVARIK